MCGIIACLKVENNLLIDVKDVLINGLTQLQNRGYDSAGIVLLENNEFIINKYASSSNEDALIKLSNSLKNTTYNYQLGIAHNRWATHGMVNDLNAHPHISNNKKIVLVHNGIIENYSVLKEFLISKNYKFYSQTDSEVIVNLLEYNLIQLQKQNELEFELFEEVIKKTLNQLTGTYGLVIANNNEPTTLYCIRNGSPLLIGKNSDYVIISSELSGFNNLIKNYITLNNNDLCKIIINTNTNINPNNQKLEIITSHNYNFKTNLQEINELSCFPYNHWTLKEIKEQPITILNALNNGGRIKNQSEVKLGGLEKFQDLLKSINNIILLGCGSSYYAGCYILYFFKTLTNLYNVQCIDASEFESYLLPKNGKTAFIIISQSGETKDLYNCVEYAKNNNIITIGIVNVVDSLIAREVDCGIYCNAGREVGVASTKSFISQITCLLLSSLMFSQIHNVSLNKRIKIISELHNLQAYFYELLNNQSLENKIKCYSEKLIRCNSSSMFILGKGCDVIIANEGALKIKELSGLHAESYSSSSLKHGPFALLHNEFPVILLNLDSSQHIKVMNNYQELKSRSSNILLITYDEESYKEETLNKNYSNIIIDNNNNNNIITIPKNKFGSLGGLIILQYIAYYLAILKGLNPDKPRNLAKVVTVD